MKKNTLKFIRANTNNIFGCHNLKGINYLTRFRLGLSHLCEHKFKNNFQETLNRLCTCGCDVKNTCFPSWFSSFDFVLLMRTDVDFGAIFTNNFRNYSKYTSSFFFFRSLSTFSNFLWVSWLVLDAKQEKSIT